MFYQGLVKTDRKVPEYERFAREEYLPFLHEHFATNAIHYGQEPEAVHGSINVPIHMSSTYAQKDIGVLYSEYDYCRVGVITTLILESYPSSLRKGYDFPGVWKIRYCFR